MPKVAIDTNVLVGFIDDDDIWHREAEALMRRLQAEGIEAVYFDCVLSESISVMAKRMRRKRIYDFIPALDDLAALVPNEKNTWSSPSWPDLYPGIVDLVRNTVGMLNFNDA